MKLEGKTAVITGAASGIGLGMAEALADRGMKVVMADVEEAPLLAQAERLQRANFAVTPCVTDVMTTTSVEQLLETALASYGKVHVLCNNAGVSGGFANGKPIWEADEQEWHWVMGVNVQGVINGVRTFVPHMLAHGEEGHVVNTSSILGLSTGIGNTYGVSKHAVARLTEGLYHDLAARSDKVGATLLCPGMIATNIVTSARNRPQGLADAGLDSGEHEARLAQMDAWFKNEGMAPREVGDMVADAITRRQFYLLTHPEDMSGIQRRFDDIMNLRNPAPPAVLPV